MRKTRIEPGFLLALLIPVIVIAPLLANIGVLFDTADMTVHLHRSHAMTLMMESGNFYPRWIPYLRMGYGYPIFNFYAPGSVTITSLLHLFGMHIVTAGNLTVILCWIFGAGGVYRLARQFLPVTGALLAVTLWSYAPSLLYETWWQGSLAQTVSTSMMPWLIFFLVRTIRQPNLRDSGWVALTFAGVILTHTPTMYITALFIGMLAFLMPVWLYRQQRRDLFRAWVYAGISLSFGIGLSAMFLLPLLAELPAVKIQSGISGTENFLRNQFLNPAELFMFPRLIDVTDITLVFPRSFGLIGGVLAATGILALSVRRRIGLALMFAGGIGFIVFMTQDVSFDVWLMIPGFRNLRYPERLLRMGALLIALAGGASLLLIPVRWRQGVLILAM
ncbi:MAG: 6-pyruvoyl-tetrahydropterin synthase-related protein, partial [Aggregatilineales bacterium]